MEGFEQEYYKFEDSVVSLTGQNERKARLAFAEKIESMICMYPDVSALYHKLGLCYYNLSFWEEGDKSAIEIAFHRALLIDPDSVFSLLFLAFYYFDVGKYQLFLRCYEKLYTSVYIKDIPDWRIKKLSGLKLSCLVYLNVLDVNNLKHEISSLIKNYKLLDKDELSAAEPIELIKALKDSKYVDSEEIAEQVKIMERMCD